MVETIRPTWDQMFLAIAKEAAKRSKDPSTKVGAVIVGPDNEVRSIGYNCFPRGVDDGAPGRLERPLKYLWIEHGERNAVYNAARVGTSLKGCRMYVSWLPCADCARAIIQSGICELVIEDLSIPDRWRENFVVSLVMLREAQIRICQPDGFKRLDPFNILWQGHKIRLESGSVERIQEVSEGGSRWCRTVIVTTTDGTRHGMSPEELEAHLERSTE